MVPPASPVSPRIERMAKAIAGEGAPSLQYEQALIVAESQVMLMRVRAARVAVIKRARKIAAAPSRLIPGFPTNHEWAHALDDLARGRPREATKLLIQGANAVRALTAKVAGADQNNEKETKVAGGDQRRLELQGNENILQPTSADPSPTAVPDEAEALRRALPQLIRLDRYEQRALSRRRRAIRNFVASSILDAVDALEAGVTKEGCEK
jgi:hypothetical protein